MPISFQCDCGKAFAVGEEHAGKRTKCPKCGAALAVPQLLPPTEDEAFRLLNEAPDPEPVAPPPRVVGTPSPRPPSPPSPPKAKPKARPRRAAERRGERPRITISAGVLGGLGSMLVGGIWFAIGWAGDVIYFYPVVLFVLGLVAVVKGFLGHGED